MTPSDVDDERWTVVLPLDSCAGMLTLQFEQIMLDHCPGSANLRTPTLTIKKCPQCGAEVEVFSNDVSVKCSTCGFVVYNDTLSCVQWCKYAKECVGEELYNKMMAQKKQG